MENNFRNRIYAILIFLLAMALFVFLNAMKILSGNMAHSFYWGLGIGILPGISTWMYLQDTWDPKNLRPKNENISTLDPKWIPLVVASGIVFARMTQSWLPNIVNELIYGFFTSWMFMGFGYMIIQVWRHR